MDKYDLLVIVANLFAIVVFGYILVKYALWYNSKLWLGCLSVIILSVSLIAFTLTKGNDE